MKRLMFTCLLVLTVLVPVNRASAAAPETCLIDRTINNAESTPTNRRYLGCDELNAGSSLASPTYVEIKDWNSDLQVDIQILTTFTGGWVTSTRAMAVASGMFSMDVNGRMQPTHYEVPNNNLMIPGGPAHLSLGFGYNAITGRWTRFNMDTNNNLNMAIQYPLDASSNVMVGIYDTSGGGPATFGTGADAGGLRVSPPTDSRFQVSDDANSNATANRMWVNSNLDQVLGTATNVNGGNRDAGTATVTLADNDPTTVSLAIIDDWDDGADRAQVDIAAQTLTAVAVSGDNAANAVGNTIFVELSDGAAAFLDNTASPGYLRLQDGDSTTLADIIGTQADGLAYTLNGLFTTSVMMLDNGATLDMAKSSITGGMIVNVENPPNAYDTGNGWVDSRKEEIATYDSGLTAGTAVDDAGTDIVCASAAMLNWPNFSVFVKNAGGGSADAFDDCDVQISYNDADWSSLTSTACDILTTGLSARCFQGSNESAPYIRVVCSCAGGDDTTADCQILGNKN